MAVIQNKVRGGQRKKDKIVAYKACMAYQTLKEPSNEKHLARFSNSFYERFRQRFCDR